MEWPGNLTLWPVLLLTLPLPLSTKSDNLQSQPICTRKPSNYRENNKTEKQSSVMLSWLTATCTKTWTRKANAVANRNRIDISQEYCTASIHPHHLFNSPTEYQKSFLTQRPTASQLLSSLRGNSSLWHRLTREISETHRARWHNWVTG